VWQGIPQVLLTRWILRCGAEATSVADFWDTFADTLNSFWLKATPANPHEI